MDQTSFKYFSQRDFDNATPPCKIEDMSEALLTQLDEAREISRMPYVVLSAYRTVEHELAQDRDGTSSHTKGLAVDIRAATARHKFLVLKGLIEAGFTRIFAYRWGFHVDIDMDKAPRVFNFF